MTSFVQPFTLTATAAIAYGKAPPSSLVTTVGAVSPLGWPVTFYDDFTGTMVVNGNNFTTGAVYPYGSSTLASYRFTNSNWGSGGVNNANMTMGASLMNFKVDTSQAGTALGSLNFLQNSWGYWEASIKMANGANGTNATFWGGWWCSGANWPTHGEMDIIEQANLGHPASLHSGTTNNSDTFPYALSRATSLPGNHTNIDGFHTYGGLLTPAYIAVYCDGVLMGTSPSGYGGLSGVTTATNPPSKPAGGFGFQPNAGQFEFLLGFFLGSAGGMPGTFNAASLPATMQCDWIRYSTLVPASGGPGPQ